MKFDPESTIRSQRENMQAYQLRLPKEVIRDLQILRVFAGVKVSEELRNLVCAYVENNRDVIQLATDSVGKRPGVALRDSDQAEAANALIEGGDFEAAEVYKPVKTVRVVRSSDGSNELEDVPTSAEERLPHVTLIPKKK
jgi:hypothetical protein